MIDGFTLTPSRTGSDITIRLVGSADMVVTTKLGSYLESLHNEAMRSGVQRVTFDIRELYFLTSSCLKCFATMLGTVAAVEARYRYSVRFLANQNLHWQRRSLEALRSVAQNIVEIDVGT